MPAILEWQGPVVATSVKTDLLARRSFPGPRSWLEGLGLRPDGRHRHPERGLDAARGLRDLGRRAAGRRLAGLGGTGGAPAWTMRTSGTPQPRSSSPRCSSQRPRTGKGRWPTSSAGRRRETEEVQVGARTAAPGGGRCVPGIEARRARRARSSTPQSRPCSPPSPTPASSPRRDARSPRRAASRRRLPHRLPLRTGARATPPPAAVRDSRPGDCRSRLRPCDRDRAAARPAAASRARRVREHRPAARPRDARFDGRRSGNPARLHLPGHGADQRRLRTRPSTDDRVEPPREGDPFRDRGPADARLRRTAARRRGGAAVLDERRRGPALDDRVGRLPQHRARERPARDATRPWPARLRAPGAGAARAPPWFRDSRLRSTGGGGT